MHAQLEYFPEKISTLSTHDGRFPSGNAILIPKQHAAANKPRFRKLFEQGQLMIERARQTQIIVVEKRDKLSSAFEQSNISRARDALIAIESHVLDAAQLRAHCGRRVRRSVINYNHLDVFAGTLRTFDSVG